MKKVQWLMAPLAVFIMTFGASCGGGGSDCGNKVVDAGEQCDDGNTIDDDACTNACRIIDTLCGNGKVEGNEVCDDGNTIDKDGCNNDCTVTPSQCGNGQVEFNEECDDGNGVDADACTNACQFPACGDGILQQDEDCDDGNKVSGDGCSGACTKDVETQTFLSGLLNLDITDNGYNGSLDAPSMTCAHLEVPDNGFNTVIDLELELGIDHTFIGDLVVKLRSPQKTVVTLLNLPGFNEPDDKGTSEANGNSSHLVSSSLVTFKNNGTTDAEEMGKTLKPGQDVCKDDGLCDYRPNAGAANPKDDFSLFAGENSVGTWDICVGDAVNIFGGKLQVANLKIKKKI